MASVENKELGEGELDEQVKAWLAQDPDGTTRSDLQRLWRRSKTDAEAANEIRDCFAASLSFGTAGLRGRLGPGPNRMNRVVVAKAAAGLVAYLLDQGASPGESVVVGYDARHGSQLFARDTAEIIEGAGLKALLLPRALPTPVLAFATRQLNCLAGVMVTASHNPPHDNGYKVYLGDGSQIVSPADADIAAQIDAIADIRSLPRGTADETVGEDVVRDYIDAAITAADLPTDESKPSPGAARKNLGVVYTPLHGVGGEVVSDALARAGFAEPMLVNEQFEPDPDFPTVRFPNPEEAGAMDLAFLTAARAQANGHDVDLILANDPDADRCAVAIESAEGWRLLHGDQVGALLASYLIDSGRSGTYATTIVSSSLLSRLTAAAGLSHQETLTGFKWIGRVPDLTFGFEEALGYCIDPTNVRDKDGISALLLVCQLAAKLKSQGKTLQTRFEELAAVHGLHLTDQLAVRMDKRTEIEAIVSELLTQSPAELGGLAVSAVDDLSMGYHGLPPTSGIRIQLGPEARVVVRPSGTEPKLKCYLEVVVPLVRGPGAYQQAEAQARAALSAIRADLEQRTRI